MNSRDTVLIGSRLPPFEHGAEALQRIGVDMPFLMRSALVDRIAHAADGDECFAAAVEQMAISYATMRASNNSVALYEDAKATLLADRTDYDELTQRRSQKP